MQKTKTATAAGPKKDDTEPAADGTMPAGQVAVGERHRKDMGDLEALADSIQKVGLLHPLVVTSEGRLVAGERRLRACRDILGWQEIPVRVLDVPSLLLAEHDENKVRKGLMPSEQVALARAIQAEIGNRQGQRTDRAPLAPTSGHLAGSSEAEAAQQAVASDVAPASGEETREVVARAAGFDSAQAYRRASKVVEQGTPELVQAMDEGALSVSAAAAAADLPVEEQQEVVQASGPSGPGRVRKRVQSTLRRRPRKVTREQSLTEVHNCLSRLHRGLSALGLWERHEAAIKGVWDSLPPKPQPRPRKARTEGAGNGKRKVTAKGGGNVKAKRAGQPTV
jgi:ParB-like chromosome segregation protein Spo0J